MNIHMLQYSVLYCTTWHELCYSVDKHDYFIVYDYVVPAKGAGRGGAEAEEDASSRQIVIIIASIIHNIILTAVSHS